jgi:hypothetical protein
MSWAAFVSVVVWSVWSLPGSDVNPLSLMEKMISLLIFLLPTEVLALAAYPAFKRSRAPLPTSNAA